MNDGKILVVPCVETGRGGGHFTRSVNLVQNLRSSGCNAKVFIKHFRPELIDLSGEDILTTEAENDIKYIILDRFRTPLNELEYWKKIAPVIGIDEGGKRRDNFDFLIDMLIPKKLAKPSANIYSPELLNTKSMKQPDRLSRIPFSFNKEKIKVLISFGQEDSAGLGIKSAKMLSSINNKDFDITLICGRLASAKAHDLPFVRTLDAIPNLAEHLFEYDLVITHYGITAYEALFASVQVVLLSPTPYHKKLARAAGFYHLQNVRKLNINKILQHYKNSSLKNIIYSDNKPSISFAELCAGFSLHVNRQCPLCNANIPKRSIARFNDRTFRKCKRCGIIYMDRLTPAPIEYEKEYFFNSYKKQYGKTYLEDFNSIKESGIRRIKEIKKIMKKNPQNNSLLDIGCAYGPFLSAAKEQGFNPTGIEPAEDAVNYVIEKLGIPVIHSTFPLKSHKITSSFDVITLWYVIEHFSDCASIYTEIKKILKPGGMLAFSTPSYSGISGRKNIKTFLFASPADHYTIWSPKMVRKALKTTGFKVIKIISSGHHPSRFPVLGKFAKKKNFVYLLLSALSRFFKLGDTFEVYARY